MNKVINGRMYDTATAERIGSYRIDDCGFVSYEETLYRKKTGEFFIMYFERLLEDEDPNCEMIMPFDIDEAKSWAEEYLTGDEYVALFGAVEE